MVDLNNLFDKLEDVILDLRLIQVETQEKLELANSLLENLTNKLEIKDEDINYDDIHTLDDLLKFAKRYGIKKEEELVDTEDEDKSNNIKRNSREILYELINPLEELVKVVGMDEIKEMIFDLIITSIQELYDQDTLFHTVITGPPGVGKTMLAKIIGEIYLRLGILQNKEYVFKIARRSDLVGKYLGHTAIKTQELIDSCTGGVLFIDEVYSLGNDDKKDSFSKECVDTINLNLTEKDNFICIVAGYPDEVENCFFAINPGLKRRFPFRYDIKGYNYEQLTNIFISKITKSSWKIDIDIDILIDFFKKNKDSFAYFGGDIDNLIMNVRTSHSRRVFGKDVTFKKIITIDDVKGGLEKLVSMKEEKKEKNPHINHMYL